MASHFRPPPKDPDFDSLKSSLAAMRNKVDTALYTTLNNLISFLQTYRTNTSDELVDINNSINTINGLIIIAADRNRTYLTATDETLYLPNSRQLLAGDNIIFDDAVANERTIRSIVQVDPDGALDGNGSTASPLAVRVDGTSITINGSNQLEAGVGVGNLIPMVTGAELPGPQIMSDGAGNLLLILYTP